MRRNKKNVQHLGFTLMIENPILKQRAVTEDQWRTMVEKYARENGLTTDQAAKKAKFPKWVPAAVSLNTRHEAHELQRRVYPNFQYRIEGRRLDYTTVLFKRERDRGEA